MDFLDQFRNDKGSKQGGPNASGGLIDESNVVSVLGVLSLLMALESEEKGSSLYAHGGEAQAWLEYYQKNKAQVLKLAMAIPKKQFDVCLARTAEKITKFIESKGFESIYGTSDVIGNSVYVAAFTSMIREWENRIYGKPAALRYLNGAEVYASKFSIGFARGPKQAPVAIAVTIGEERAFIKNLDKDLGDEFGLSVAIIDGPSESLSSDGLLKLGESAVNVLNSGWAQHARGYKDGKFETKSIVVPFMKLHVNSNLDFLKKIGIGPLQITETNLQGNIICDHKGYSSEVVASLKSTRGGTNKHELFHRPIFVLMAEVDGEYYVVEVTQMGQDALVEFGINDQIYQSDKAYWEFVDNKSNAMIVKVADYSN